MTKSKLTYDRRHPRTKIPQTLAVQNSPNLHHSPCRPSAAPHDTMSVEECSIPIHAPFRERASFRTAGVRYGSLPSLRELDLVATAVASGGGTASAAYGEVSGGAAGSRNRALKILNRPLAVPPEGAAAPLGPLPDTARRHHIQTPSMGGKVSWDDSGLHLLMPSFCKENFRGWGRAEPSSVITLQQLKDALPGKPNQSQPSEVAVSRTAPRARYPRSKAGWASKGRSTPEYKRDEHSWRFQHSAQATDSIIRDYKAAYLAPTVVHPQKKQKSPEERNAIREKRAAQRKKASLNHAETALRKYNRTNNTKFELVEITAICPFFEFGEGCCHYNFTAKPENNHSAMTQLFFAEINYFPRSENDVLVCCTVGEEDAGHCYACKNHRPMIHPSSRLYGGGNTTAINYPEDSSSSDSDY